MNPLPDFSERLLVFARELVLGRVKTRLAAGIGAAAALAVYRELLALTAAAQARVPATVWLAEAPTPLADRALPRPEWPGLPWHVQPATDSLGARMAHAFGGAFAGGASRVVIIGTDCPGLSADLLRQAFDYLKTHDLVLGPADDGGYYLLGMNELQPALFEQKTRALPPCCPTPWPMPPAWGCAWRSCLRCTTWIRPRTWPPGAGAS